MNKNSAPSTQRKIMPRKLVAGAAALAFIGGSAKAAYEVGQSSQQAKFQVESRRAYRNGYENGINGFRSVKELRADVRLLQTLDIDNGGLERRNIFDTAGRIQKAIFDLSDGLTMPHEKVVEAVMSEGAVDELAANGVHIRPIRDQQASRMDVHRAPANGGKPPQIVLPIVKIN